MLEHLPVDWFLLLLRVLFVFLLYFFLYQLVRVTGRELVALATAVPEERRASGAAGRLVVVDGGRSGLAAGTAFGLGARTTVGRHPGCTVALDEPSVSAEHAELTADGGGWWVRDLGSTNGTFVNQTPIPAGSGASAQPGDVVQFGRVALQLAP